MADGVHFGTFGSGDTSVSVFNHEAVFGFGFEAAGAFEENFRVRFGVGDFVGGDDGLEVFADFEDIED